MQQSEWNGKNGKLCKLCPVYHHDNQYPAQWGNKLYASNQTNSEAINFKINWNKLEFILQKLVLAVKSDG